MASAGEQLERLRTIIEALLAPGGCPWDRQQTHESLRPYLIEEAYEVLDAIDQGSPEGLREELGDLLMQVVFHSELARKAGQFELSEVIAGIGDKLLRRHPHVFGDEEVDSAGEVKQRWDELKRAEGRQSACDGVPRALPALRRGRSLGERLASVGFDWSDLAGPREKLDEEVAELDEAAAGDDPDRVAEELGDVLFALVNLARHLRVDPEDALRAALDRVEGRFRAVESRLARQDRRPEQCTIDELEALWQWAKQRQGA